MVLWITYDFLSLNYGAFLHGLLYLSQNGTDAFNNMGVIFVFVMKSASGRSIFLRHIFINSLFFYNNY